jgi:hypothetical protein
MFRKLALAWGLFCLLAAMSWGDDARPVAAATLFRSAKSGAWSQPATWEGGRVPAAGDKVQIRTGHVVTYDLVSDQAIRSIHVAGTLQFDPDRNTVLNVGLIKIQAGDDASENGFDCDIQPDQIHSHGHSPGHSHAPRPALQVGTFDHPIPAGHTAKIRLVAIDGMDKETCPAIVCCGGRMDLHGAPLGDTWVKLGQTAHAGDAEITLSQPVTGWKPGDKIIVTATQRIRRERGTLRADQGKDSFKPFTEERRIVAIDGNALTLDKPLAEEHSGEGRYRGEVANLTRNVVIESADPAQGRGHTMYHRGSAGGISYAEFRHLGKEGVLGKYSTHFHLVGDTMRGSSVVGASFWDSGNRWLTIHGTNYLVVRDCVGYQSVGHGYFLEDGTEVNNVLDHNLAVQAFSGNPLPKQVLPYDNNGGAGFWWANSRNSFTRNVAVECDRYGFKFEAEPVKTATPGVNVIVKEDTPETFDLKLPVAMPQGGTSIVDIRTLPFIRFEDNEAHGQLYGINLGEGVRGVGPDEKHPFILKNTNLWNNFWHFRPGTPATLVDGMDMYNGRYGLYRPAYKQHAYARLTIAQIENPQAFSSGAGPEGFNVPGPPPAEKRAAITKQAKEVGKGAVVTRAALGPFIMSPHIKLPNLPEVEATSGNFPAPLQPVDDLPPATVITSVSKNSDGRWIVRGTTCDNGAVQAVLVNGQEGHELRPNFAEWEVVLSGGASAAGKPVALIAFAKDAAGNIEKRPHEVTLPQ